MEANIVVLGTERVGKSGDEIIIPPGGDAGVCSCLVSLSHALLSPALFFSLSALTVRLLTRRFIGEYGDVGERPIGVWFRSKENTLQPAWT